MNLFFIAVFALAPFGQTSPPSHVAKANFAPIARAYAHAAKLPPISSKPGFTLRVWSRGYMLGRVHGFVVADGRLRALTTDSTYGNGKVTITPATLSPSSPVSDLRKLKALVIKLWPHNGSSISCGIMDGGSVLVHASLNGHVVAVQADNPSFCADQASKIIVQLLQELRSQASSGVSPNSSFKADARKGPRAA